MWGRRTSRTSDTASTARRRLAAIAAEFDRSPVPDQGSSPAPSTPVRPTPAPTTADSEGGRHRGPGGVWDRRRWRLSVHHVAVLTFGAAVLLSLAAWWALRAVPAEEPVPQSDRLGVPTHPSADSPSPGTPSVSTPVDGVPAPAVTAAAAPALVVDVTGKVRRPGIVELSPGSRVVDALAAAGGARPGVDTTGLNLARLLVDGEQIVVGLAIPSMRDTTEAPAVSAPSTGPALGSINVNTASQAELETLPDIGPVTAQAIVDWRRENGSFASVDQLVDVSGIGEATLQDIEPYVHV